MEFFDWTVLGTLTGAVFAVAIITQLIKELPFVAKFPTQIVSYVLAFVLLLAAQTFTGGLSASTAALSVINAAMVSLAANGGYAALKRLQEGLDGKEKPPEE